VIKVGKIVIYSEKTELARELVTAALEIQGAERSVTAVCINDEEQTRDLAARGIAVVNLSAPGVHPSDTASTARALQQVVDELEAELVLLASNRRGKELAGRLAQRLNAGCLTDVTGMAIQEGRLACTRNTLGGATVATQFIKTARQVIAVAPRTYEPAAEKPGGSVDDMTVSISAASGIKLVETRARDKDSVDITTADLLVVVGQGLENQEDLVRAAALARFLGGEVACTKPVATDRKWLSEERVIGLSGKTCKPQLAILLGISGQVQFTVGIRDARTIIAINNDENAPIFQMADYVMVADLADVLPPL
jgi:electron transfer flavoprotein alpha subunit